MMQRMMSSEDREDMTSSTDDEVITDSNLSLECKDYYEFLRNNETTTSSFRKISEDDEKLFIPATKKRNKKELSFTPSGALVNKQEVRKVCKKISHSLGDKTSQSRGTRMFRKRRKRAERFAIIGYGKQLVEESTSDYTDDVARESDIYSYTSSDDDIPAYDQPSLNNLILQDSQLSSSQKIVRHQFHNLAKDVKNLRSKGANLFAKRQKEMEQYTTGSSCDNRSRISSSSDFEDHVRNDKYISDKDSFESDSDNISPISFCELPHKQSMVPSRPIGDFVPDEDITISSLSKRCYVQENPDAYFDLRQKTAIRKDENNYYSYHQQPSMTHGEDFKHTADYLNEHQSLEITKQLTDLRIHKEDQQKGFVFKSIKPPTPKQKVEQEDTKELMEVKKYDGADSAFPSFLRKPNKGWSPVKFQPKNKNDCKNIEVFDEPYFLLNQNPLTNTLPSSKIPARFDVLAKGNSKRFNENPVRQNPLERFGMDAISTDEYKIQSFTSLQHPDEDKNSPVPSSSSKSELSKVNKFGSCPKHFNRPINFAKQEKNKTKENVAENVERLNRKSISTCLRVLSKDKSPASKESILQAGLHSSCNPLRSVANGGERSTFHSPMVRGFCSNQENKIPTSSRSWQGLPSNSIDKELTQGFQGATMFAKQHGRIEQFTKDSFQKKSTLKDLHQFLVDESTSDNGFQNIRLSKEHDDISTMAKNKNSSGMSCTKSQQRPKIAPKPKLPHVRRQSTKSETRKNYPSHNNERQNNGKSVTSSTFANSSFLQPSQEIVKSETKRKKIGEMSNKLSPLNLPEPAKPNLNESFPNEPESSCNVANNSNHFSINRLNQKADISDESPQVTDKDQSTICGNSTTSTGFLCPKPRFKAKSPVKKWQPGSKDD